MHKTHISGTQDVVAYAYNILNETARVKDFEKSIDNIMIRK